MNFAITDITFNNSGDAIASCTITPALPAGLSINSTTCTISGTPTEVKDTTLYTVTAKSASNNTDVAIFPLTKPAGSVGAAVQLVIAPPELLKVMSLIAEPIVAIWSTAFAILGQPPMQRVKLLLQRLI
jgi:hypothetical protein